MMKILVIHSFVDETQEPPRKASDGIALLFANSLEREVLKELDITSLSQDLTSGRIPRGYDIYLIHPIDVRISDLADLKRGQPNSLFCCLNRWRENVTKKEQNLYDYFTYWVGEKEGYEILAQARRRMCRR